MVAHAHLFRRSAYTATCLTLVERLGETLIPGEERLSNAVKDAAGWITWSEDYPPER